MLNAVRSRLTYANTMATVAVFLALGGGAYALSGIPDGGGVYHGCVASSGALRVVSKASSCLKARTVNRGSRRVRVPGESAITWNQQGRPGANGVNGWPRAAGPTGTGRHRPDGIARGELADRPLSGKRRRPLVRGARRTFDCFADRVRQLHAFPRRTNRRARSLSQRQPRLQPHQVLHAEGERHKYCAHLHDAGAHR